MTIQAERSERRGLANTNIIARFRGSRHCHLVKASYVVSITAAEMVYKAELDETRRLIQILGEEMKQDKLEAKYGKYIVATR